MKKIALVLSLVLCTCFLFSCTKDAFVPAGYKRISNDDAPYRLYVPEEWVEDVSTSITSAYVSSNDKSNISFYGCEIDDTVLQVKVNKETKAALDTEKPEETTSAETTAIETTSDTTEETTAEIVTIDDYWDYYEKEFNKTFSDLTYISKGKNCVVSGIESKRYEYTATVTGTLYRFMQTVTIVDGYAYIFTFTTIPDNYDTNIETVEQILGYLEIK